MQPANGIVGEDFGTSLPETQVDKEQLDREESLAKFSKTREYQKLKEHLQSRIEFYQTYLPNGRATVELMPQQAGEMWIIANAVIGEFNAVLNAYQEAAKAVGARDV